METGQMARPSALRTPEMYMIVDQDGNSITSGLQGPEVSDQAYQVAQDIANSRNETVWLTREDGEGKEIEFSPEA